VTSRPTGTVQIWDPRTYDTAAAYVSAYGSDLVTLLAPCKGETVLDLGCGTGTLTAKIAQMGAAVIGLDSSPEMIRLAQEQYPQLQFRVGAGQDFALAEPVDAVFSNAALHWMKPPESVIRSVAAALKPGGRFVAELGGKGNVSVAVKALYQAMAEVGVKAPEQCNPWFFPSVAEYAGLLEASGFRVRLMQHYDRPTPLHDCEHGLADWLGLFAGSFLAAVPDSVRRKMVDRVMTLTEPELLRAGTWYVDYVRLAFIAERS
jgi:trans-aconitate methyltransferase